MGERTEDSKPPEDLFNGLKITDPQESECASSLASSVKDEYIHNKQLKDVQDQGEEECFHDCNDSFEDKEDPRVEESKDEMNPSELEEEYLLRLEKDMPDDEKQKRREESTRLKEEGNEQFKKGEYVEAESSYSRALQTCPACYQKDRSVLFSNRAAARMKQDKKDAAINDCSKAIELNPSYIRALLRRAELYEKTDKLDEALEDYKSVLEKDPSIYQAGEACMRLPKQIEERNEKLKAEMLDDPWSTFLLICSLTDQD
ncbi:tetratricopeptide repeat protein 1 isoform X2 [Sminthopsis crassicaudata]|uniref:tetratricopeptide repeat protein 1 isoform X2 n=1 Tax=Sminthopsis crassicaudata TaxID=9301 RepID=UPI003D681B0C